MVASLLRILNSGIQDSRLLPPRGMPRIEMFQKVFIRAGRFTTAFVRLDFDTRPALGTFTTLTIPRKGQMLARLYLVTTLPDIRSGQLAAKNACDASGVVFLGPNFGWTNSVGHAILAEARIEIGGSRVERLDGRLLEVLDEFYTPLEKVTAMNGLLPRLDNGFYPGVFGRDDGGTVAVTPLPFWFSCGDSGAFLPIDAIQADSVVLRVEYNSIANIYVCDSKLLPVDGGSQCAGLFPVAGSSFYYADPKGSIVPGLGSAVPALPVPKVKMPAVFPLGDTYLMAEYIYLDRPEANRFRIADIRIPVVQHYPFDPVDTHSAAKIQIPLKIPNPTRNLFFYCHRREASELNAPFLATRDLSGASQPIAPWWPDATGLRTTQEGDYSPGYSTSESEPLSSLALFYEGRLARYWTNAPSLFRSYLPSFDMRKSPWHHRYYYTLPFSLDSGHMPPSLPSGEANLDKLVSIDLALEFHPNRGSVNPNDVPQYFVYIWAETYNILRVFGGRAGLLFGY
jgi:Major capsid protein N-terminus